jgi:hypothetical protein
VIQPAEKQAKILEELRNHYADLLRIENQKFMTSTTTRLKTL